MNRRAWWISAALLTVAGCGEPGVNSNESNFPGAPGSKVSAPAVTPEAAPAKGTAGPSMGPGDGGALPSNYPGINNLKKADAPKTEDASKPATKPADAPAPKPADAPSAKPADAPKDKPADAPAPKLEAPKPAEPKKDAAPAPK